MERSQKVLYVDGASSFFASLSALIGAAAASLFVYDSFSPLWGAVVEPVCHADAKTIVLMVVICLAVFWSSFLSVWLMSKQRAARENIELALDAGTRNLLKKFFSVMAVGGLLCLTPIVNGHWELIPGFMLVFYGLALVMVSLVVFRISISKYIGCAQIAVGLAALCLPQYGLMFWTIGFCLLHIVWGCWFHFSYDRK